MNRMKRLLCLGLICYFCCLSMIVYGNEKTSPFYLAELKCENLIDPLGIDNVTPHFSWKLKGDGWKDGQTYYEIQVASDSILMLKNKLHHGVLLPVLELASWISHRCKENI